MSEWTLWQFDSVVDSFLSACTSKMKATLVAKLDLLSDKGNLAGRPLTGHLREGIFELRATCGMQPRLLFFFKSEKRILFVHALFKKRGRIPDQDLELAIQRKKMIESGKVTVNAIGYVN